MTVIQSQVSITTQSPLPNGFVGQPYSVTFTGTSTPAGTLQWSLNDTPLPPGLQLSQSGVLSGTPSSPALGVNISVLAHLPQPPFDVLPPETTKPFTINIYAGQVNITTNSLPVAVLNQPYSAQLAAVPATEGLTWSLSGNVPPGLTFDSGTGTFSGTPTNSAGVYSIQAQASLLNYSPATKNFTLYVVSEPLRILESGLPVAIQNQPYQATLTPSGGLGPYTWSISSNGAGLTIDPQKGTLTGTPKNLGPVTVPIQLTDATGTTYSQAFTLFVAGPLNISTASLPNGSVNTPYPALTQLQAGGGQAPYNWTLMAGSGSLPPGLTLSDTGLISGTPTANGVYNFTVQVTDAGKRTATKALSITIGTPTPLTIGTASLPNGVIGTSYSETLAATGGTGAYTWSISSGNLPAGLTLNTATGAISGTPSALGSSAFTMQVSDSATPPNTAQKALTLNVVNAGQQLNVTTGTFQATAGVAFSQALATGGTAPYAVTITSGSLPAGLSLASASISGTPTAAGTNTIAFTVTDTNGQTGSGTITITVSAPSAPQVTINTGAPTSTGNEQRPVGLTLENPFPQDIAGTFTLTFQGSNGAEDPNVQFLSSAGGSRSMTFTVPAGSKTLPNPPSIATGTVAGTITITTNLTANGTALDPAPPPQTIVIPPAPPVITSVTFSNTNGLTVTVIGYSTTRDMTSGDFVFSAAPGSSLQNSDIPVQLGPAFTQWYAASASNPFGSQFKLTVPFNVTTGSASSVTSVSVSLTNSQGKSAPVSAQ